MTGTAISWDGHFNAQIENDIFSSVIDLVLNCAAFIYIGAWLPFETYNSPEVCTASLISVILIYVFSSTLLPGGLSSYSFVSLHFAGYPHYSSFTSGFLTLLTGVKLCSQVISVRFLFLGVMNDTNVAHTIY